MDILASSSPRIHESNLELYRSRLAGRLCISLVCAGQIIPRLIIIIGPPAFASWPEFLLLASLPILLFMIGLIVTEYILFKKTGPRMAKYAQTVDLILLLLFIADWTVTMVGTLNKIEHTDPPTFEVTAMYGFTYFSWKTLLVTLIVQNWQLKIIPPSVATIICAVYAMVYVPNQVFLNIIRSLFQLVNIIFIIYCEDKIKWRMVWTNLHREKWVQVNNFILNNIPENTMILSFAGEIKFISDHCKSFMKKNHISCVNTQDLFNKIRDLQQQYEPELGNSTFGIHTERMKTQSELFNPELTEANKIEALENLILNFRKIIEETNLQERQFLIYHGKLTLEKDFPEKSIEIKISYIHHIENEYIILIFRDTTQRDLLVTLQETNKYKDQLLASVSHELRAPLNGNINLVESAITSPKIPENMKESLLVPALRSSKFLLHIINDMLDMSQIKEKKLRLVFQPGDLKETLKSAAQLIELQAQKKGIELVLNIDPKLPGNFCTDHMRLSQIVLNLLSNAIKFTREGMIKLTAIPMAKEENWVKIIVEDSGIGIRQENIHKLFSSYSTIELEERQAITSSGVGLGLNISSNLADLLAPKSHPGISVSSTPGQGSIFSFIIENKEIIPTQPEKPSEESGSSTSRDLSSSSYEIADELPGRIPLPKPLRTHTNNDSSASMILPLPMTTRAFELETLVKEKCSCPKILIVDDNPFNIMAFETILNSLDIKCDSVYSGSACIQKLHCRQNKACGEHCMPYSVVFMDQEMPEMTGSETLEEIKRLQKEDKIPEMKIIGCTAHKAKEEVDKFMQSGLDQCIYKPISVGMIKDILKEILSSE